MKLKTVRDLNVKGKTCLVRVDLNVLLDRKNEITDDFKIRASLPTIEYLREQGAKIILLTHLGRPQGKEDTTLQTKVLVDSLKKLTKAQVHSVGVTHGPIAKKAVQAMKPGEILLLENIRFEKGEFENDKTLAKNLAQLADFFINDSFGTAHRMHASTVGVTQFLPSAAGLLIEQELAAIDAFLEHPKKPVVVVLAGGKVTEKLKIISRLLKMIDGQPFVDTLLLGGAPANTFLYAQGHEVGESLVDRDDEEMVQDLMLKMEQYGERLILPEDLIVADEFDGGSARANLPLEDIDFNMKIVDIGTQTLQDYMQIIQGAGTIFWNGPLGAFQIAGCSRGTEEIGRAIAESKAQTIVGGGDTLLAIHQLGLEGKFTHTSTGGGALLQYLAGEVLPAIEVLR